MWRNLLNRQHLRHCAAGFAQDAIRETAALPRAHITDIALKIRQREGRFVEHPHELANDKETLTVPEANPAKVDTDNVSVYTLSSRLPPLCDSNNVLSAPVRLTPLTVKDAT